MKHNAHFMAWLESLRDEAKRDETTLSRTLEIMGIILKYTQHQ